MMDIVCVLIVGAFLMLSWTLVMLCDHLAREDE
jgi:hypothetical protein